MGRTVPASFKKTGETIINQGTTTYVPPNGCKRIVVHLRGAGGSGGGAATGAGAACGSGGGGGAYSRKTYDSPKASYACVVGAGGAAPSAGSNPGLVGNDTSFDGGTAALAKGGGVGGASGAAATSAAVQGGPPGLASGGFGDITLDGDCGDLSFVSSATVAGSGAGGDAPGIFGGGGGRALVAAGAGVAGSKWGGGGSGGANINNSAAVAGGAGADGVIVVEEFTQG